MTPQYYIVRLALIGGKRDRKGMGGTKLLLAQTAMRGKSVVLRMQYKLRSQIMMVLCSAFTNTQCHI